MVWAQNPIVDLPGRLFRPLGRRLHETAAREIISVDPRHTWLSTRAKYHLQLRPGTDGALALGMIHVIINESLYDKEFVEKWTFGFDKLKERVQQYPPSNVVRNHLGTGTNHRESGASSTQRPSRPPFTGEFLSI